MQKLSSQSDDAWCEIRNATYAKLSSQSDDACCEIRNATYHNYPPITALIALK